MKQLTKFLVFLTVAVMFATTTYGQGGASTTASATAVIITPITITKVTDMSFGNLAVNATAGTVILTAEAVATRTPSGGVSNVAGGTVSAASFTVTGLTGTTYSITLPANGTITLTGPGTPMALDDFVSTPTVAAGGSLATGTETLYVGATLSIAGDQTPGTYTNAAFPVTVNYN